MTREMRVLMRQIHRIPLLRARARQGGVGLDQGSMKREGFFCSCGRVAS